MSPATMTAQDLPARRLFLLSCIALTVTAMTFAVRAGMSALGIFLLSIASGSMTYVAAIVFAIGICYFWPTMVGFIAEYKAETGALGMSVLGGMGMIGFSLWTPVIGGWIDSAKEAAAAIGLEGGEANLAAGQDALGNILWLPLGLTVFLQHCSFYESGFKGRMTLFTKTPAGP